MTELFPKAALLFPFPRILQEDPCNGIRCQPSRPISFNIVYNLLRRCVWLSMPCPDQYRSRCHPCKSVDAPLLRQEHFLLTNNKNLRLTAENKAVAINIIKIYLDGYGRTGAHAARPRAAHRTGPDPSEVANIKTKHLYSLKS